MNLEEYESLTKKENRALSPEIHIPRYTQKYLDIIKNISSEDKTYLLFKIIENERLKQIENWKIQSELFENLACTSPKQINKPDLSLVNNKNQTLLMSVLSKDNMAFQTIFYAKTLYELNSNNNQININYQDNEGNTVFHYVSNYITTDIADSEVFEILKNLKASPNIENNQGETPFTQILDYHPNSIKENEIFKQTNLLNYSNAKKQILLQYTANKNPEILNYIINSKNHNIQKQLPQELILNIKNIFKEQKNSYFLSLSKQGLFELNQLLDQFLLKKDNQSNKEKQDKIIL